MGNPFEELMSILEEASVDADKFYDKGNKTAGTRLRKAMQAVREKAKVIRADVQSRKNAS